MRRLHPDPPDVTADRRIGCDGEFADGEALEIDYETGASVTSALAP